MALDSERLSLSPAEYLRPRLWVVLFTLVGLFNRFHDLDYRYMYTDEAISSNAAAASPLLQFPPVTPGGATYFGHWTHTYLVAIFFEVFGYTDVVGRSLSALLGVVSIPLVYFVGKEIYDEDVAVVATGLVTFSSFAMFWSRMIRHYALALFLSLLLVFAFYRLRDRRGLRVTALLVLTLVGQQTFPGLVFLALALGVVALAERFRERAAMRWLFPGLVTALLVGFGVSATGAVESLLPVVNAITTSVPGSPSVEGPVRLVVFQRATTTELLTVFSVLAAVVGFALGLDAYRPDSGRALAILFVVPVFLMLISGAFVGRALTPRYFFFLYPYGLLLAAVGGVEAGRYLCDRANVSFGSERGLARRDLVRGMLLVCVLLTPALVSFAPDVAVNDGYVQQSFVYTYPDNPNDGPYPTGPPLLQMRDTVAEIKQTDERVANDEEVPVVIVGGPFTGVNQLHWYLNEYEYGDTYGTDYQMYQFRKNIMEEKLVNETHIQEAYVNRQVVQTRDRYQSVVDSSERGWMVIVTVSYYQQDPTLYGPAERLTHVRSSPSVELYHWNNTT